MSEKPWVQSLTARNDWKGSHHLRNQPASAGFFFAGRHRQACNPRTFVLIVCHADGARNSSVSKH